VVNYRPTTSFDDGTVPASVTAKESTEIARLKAIPFGVLITRYAYHTAILSRGKVFETHWDVGPWDPAGSKPLFDATDFEKDWSWLSGMIMVPRGFW
jgi:hypothetical protein